LFSPLRAALVRRACQASVAGRPQFYDLLRCARKPAYVAFDLLWPDGVDLRSLPSERASGGACKESFPRFTGHCRSPLRSRKDQVPGPQ
jgi:hypothetical protein